MPKQIDTPRAAAIVSVMRTAGFRCALEVLDNLAEEAKDQAFTNDDGSNAMRLVHEGRGAVQLVREFNKILANLEITVRQLPQQE